MMRWAILLLLLPGAAHAAAEARYYVATLPACVGSSGVKYIARDALGPVKGQAVVGLGHRAVRVICTSGAWIVKDM